MGLNKAVQYGRDREMRGSALLSPQPPPPLQGAWGKRRCGVRPSAWASPQPPWPLLLVSASQGAVLSQEKGHFLPPPELEPFRLCPDMKEIFPCFSPALWGWAGSESPPSEGGGGNGQSPRREGLGLGSPPETPQQSTHLVFSPNSTQEEQIHLPLTRVSRPFRTVILTLFC